MVREIVFTLYKSYEEYCSKDQENKIDIVSIKHYIEKQNEPDIIDDENILGYMTYYAMNFEDICSANTGVSFFTIEDHIHEKCVDQVLAIVNNAILELKSEGITVYVPDPGEGWGESVTINPWVFGINRTRLQYPQNRLPLSIRKQILVWHLTNWKEELEKLTIAVQSKKVYCYKVPQVGFDF